MSANINRVLLAGNLTRNPQVKFFSERAVANFGIAVNERWKDKDGQAKESTTFVDVEAWGRTAELVGQYLTKGRACFIEGRLKLDQWDDKDGQKRSKLKVVADSVQFLDSKRDGAGDDAPPQQRQAAAGRPAAPAPASADTDEPPF
ncbi:MAG: single-stranded DNA-binding protein [Methylibium sp.]|nr:single-stranded DNA-binding protein [Methylibium sp.]